MGKRVLVCGGRHYKNRAMVFRVLTVLHEREVIDVLIHGGPARRDPGADEHANAWAVHTGVRFERYDAEWKAHGRGAGPRRNQRMLVEGLPDMVIAFTGGPGTADMMRRSWAANVPVFSYP